MHTEFCEIPLRVSIKNVTKGSEKEKKKVFDYIYHLLYSFQHLHHFTTCQACDEHK